MGIESRVRPAEQRVTQGHSAVVPDQEIKAGKGMGSLGSAGSLRLSQEVKSVSVR